MVYLLIGSICFAAINNVLLHILSHKNLKYNGFLFNAFVSTVWMVLLFVYNLGMGEFTLQTVLFGGLYAFTLAGFLFFKQQALTLGPIMISSLIGCSSFVFTTLFNAIYWKEELGIFEILGILLMIAAVVTVSYQPKSKEEQGESKSLRSNGRYAQDFSFYLLR